MDIVVVGLNHKTAPVEVRERLALGDERVKPALKQLKQRYPNKEFVLLSTCNRMEIYRAGKKVEKGVDELMEFIAEFCGVERNEFEQYLYVYRSEKAVGHLLKVGASLDSMVVGEAQIIGQVKESYRWACQVNSAGKVLNRLFHCAFTTSKEVYTMTSIAQRRVSVAGVAVELAGRLPSRHVQDHD